MWYAALPTFAIIAAALSVPNIYCYFSNKLFYGQPYRRVIIDKETAFMHLRDSRLSKRNWAYDYNGLENIPDQETTNQSN